MSDIVVDSSVVAKWVLPEPDSDQAHALLTRASASADRLVILDLALPEVANAIWKRQRRHLIDLDEARNYLRALFGAPCPNRRGRATAPTRLRNRHAIRPCGI